MKECNNKYHIFPFINISESKSSFPQNVLYKNPNKIPYNSIPDNSLRSQKWKFQPKGVRQKQKNSSLSKIPFQHLHQCIQFNILITP